MSEKNSISIPKKLPWKIKLWRDRIIELIKNIEDGYMPTVDDIGPWLDPITSGLKEKILEKFTEVTVENGASNYITSDAIAKYLFPKTYVKARLTCIRIVEEVGQHMYAMDLLKRLKEYNSTSTTDKHIRHIYNQAQNTGRTFEELAFKEADRLNRIRNKFTRSKMRGGILGLNTSES